MTGRNPNGTMGSSWFTDFVLSELSQRLHCAGFCADLFRDIRGILGRSGEVNPKERKTSVQEHRAGC